MTDRVDQILAALEADLPEQFDEATAMRLCGIAYMQGYEDSTVERLAELRGSHERE